MKGIVRTLLAAILLTVSLSSSHAADADTELRGLTRLPGECTRLVSGEGTPREREACRTVLVKRIARLEQFAKDGYVGSLRIASMIWIMPGKRCAVASKALTDHRASLGIVVDFLADQIRDQEDVMHRVLAPKVLKALSEKLVGRSLRDAYVEYARDGLDSYEKSFAKCDEKFNAWLYGILPFIGDSLKKKSEALFKLLGQRLAARDEKALLAAVHVLIIGGAIVVGE